ncbi:MAG: DUF2239 family protein [Betaproteobacteria bacterium]
MTIDQQPVWIAFAGTKRIAFGTPREVAAKTKNFVDTNRPDAVLIFDAVDSWPVEIDLRGSVKAVLKKLGPAPGPAATPAADAPAGEPRPVGRPKLGVVAREVTLLPRHWDWLASQTGGASVALRKLVEQAARASRQEDRVRQAREATYRFMHAMAGNEPGFEDATRALFAADNQRFSKAVARWPADVRNHALALAEAASREQEEP